MGVRLGERTPCKSEIRDHVLAGSATFTDELKSYEGLDEFQHEVINHAVAYVNGGIS